LEEKLVENAINLEMILCGMCLKYNLGKLHSSFRNLIICVIFFEKARKKCITNFQETFIPCESFSLQIPKATIMARDSKFTGAQLMRCLHIRRDQRGKEKFRRPDV
jgi:hypothetical protein